MVMKPIDPLSPIPYYYQVMNVLREQMQYGVWKPGDQLPSEADLCQMFSVSRTVVRQALMELTHEGFVVRRKGKGSFVAEAKVSESLVQKLTGFYQDMTARGYKPVSRVLKQRVIPASSKVAARLNIPAESPVTEIERVRLIEDKPIVLVTTYIPVALCPDLVHEDLSSQSLYALLEQKYAIHIARGHRTIQAVQANEYEAKLLEIDYHAPLVMLDSTSYLEDGTPVEFYHALHRGDRSRFEVELVRTRDLGGGTRSPF